MKFQENNDIGCMYKQWFKNKVKHKQRAHYISVDLRINRYHFCTQGVGASEKKPKENYIILQGGELTCFHFFKSSC